MPGLAFQVTIEEFIEGTMKLKGSAKSHSVNFGGLPLWFSNHMNGHERGTKRFFLKTTRRFFDPVRIFRLLVGSKETG